MEENKSLAPSVTHSDPKGRKHMDIVGQQFDKAGFSEEEAQRVNETPGLAKLLQDFYRMARIPKDYLDEEVESNYGYLSGYTRPIAISDQIDILRGYWPNLNPDAALNYYREVYGALQFPEWVEGPFALIRPGFFSDKYGEELEEILKVLEKARSGRFMNYCKGKLNAEYLIQTEQSLAAMARIVAQQPNSDIVIVPEQFGIRYPIGGGKHIVSSVRRAMVKFVGDEYGEGAKNVGTMILTHPKRLAHFDDLWMDCPGDRYRPDAVGGFCDAPYFFFYGDEAGFDTSRVGSFNGSYGSVSGALPECLKLEI